MLIDYVRPKNKIKAGTTAEKCNFSQRIVKKALKYVFLQGLVELFRLFEELVKNICREDLRLWSLFSTSHKYDSISA